MLDITSLPLEQTKEELKKLIKLLTGGYQPKITIYEIENILLELKREQT